MVTLIRRFRYECVGVKMIPSYCMKCKFKFNPTCIKDELIKCPRCGSYYLKRG